MSELVYDPQTKQQIKDKVFHFIYDPVYANFQKQLDTIIRKNAQLWVNRQEYMRYRNKIHATSAVGPAGPYPRKINLCHPGVRPQMRDYLREVDRLNQQEIPYVLGFITQVLNASNSLQDYFKVFPESVHQPIRDLVHRCNCRTHSLTKAQVTELQEKNQVPLSLMKQRMVLNLLQS